MTKTYAITEEQRDEWLAIMRNNLQDPEAYDAITELESLPLITGEPAAYTWDTIGSGGMSGGYRMAHFQINTPERTATMLDFKPLYTHPQPLQPITADAADFAGWLVDKHEQEIIYEEHLIEWLADFIKHRSEAK